MARPLLCFNSSNHYPLTSIPVMSIAMSVVEPLHIRKQRKGGSEDCCSWDGVTCDLVTGHVIELDLSCSWLSGTIHPNSTLFLFSHLQSLNLAFNNFSASSVSVGFGHFSSLTHLNLSGSEFSGLISPEISHLSNLVLLDLSWNFEVELAPLSFRSLAQNLTKLQKLHLAGIPISSVFPNSLLNRSSLISLDLSNTELHGRFPDHHDIHLPKLQFLSLRGNDDLSGNFPRFSENNSLMLLDLSRTNFSGELPASMGNLKSLQTLNLFLCQFSGTIPTSMGNLKSLQTLDLFACQFSGSIPTSIGNLKSLQTLDLSDSQFSGSIPASLQNLKQLTSLNLNSNHFSGKIPKVFGNLRNLIYLGLSENNFTGQIPPSIGNVTNLRVLDLSHNRLEGAIPSTVKEFSSLSYVSLGYNLLNGTVPSWLYTLPSLMDLDISHNKFIGRIGELKSDSLQFIDLSMNELHGSIPCSLFEFVNLRYLSLSSNNLSGSLETSKFEKLRKLTHLDLSNNMLSLTVSVHSNSMLPYIERIDLSNNNITGMFSWNVGKDTLGYLNLSFNSISGFEMLPWSSMQILDLRSNLLQGPLPIPPNSTYIFSISHNKLSGEISPLICKARSMEILDLSHNNFGGMLPHCLGNFSKDLCVLNLRRNQFHGTIPQTFLKVNSLRTLDFNNNQLKGLVPRSSKALRKLQVLVLHSNHFHGYIGFSKIKSPFMSLRIIDLAHNDFEGDLPEMYLRSLKAIMNIDEGNVTREYMGTDNYQDSIMMTIKGQEIEFVKILNTFTTIDLSSNKFQGGIPECIGNLNSLRGLNLSHNHLTGHIPSSFRNLKMLESLDLSSNELSGRIPEELTSLTFLEVLNLSQNHLTGLIPRGNQFSTFGNDSYCGNSELCGFPLSKRCTTDGVLKPSPEIETEFGNAFDWKITLMGYGCGLVIGLSLGCLIFLSGKPEWLVWIIDKNIHKMIVRNKRSTTHKRAAQRN